MVIWHILKNNIENYIILNKTVASYSEPCKLFFRIVVKTGDFSIPMKGKRVSDWGYSRNKLTEDVNLYDRNSSI